MKEPCSLTARNVMVVLFTGWTQKCSPATDKFDHLMSINTDLHFASVLKYSFQKKFEVKAV